eukprot:662243-Prymnesium_polylepis.1
MFRLIHHCRPSSEKRSRFSMHGAAERSWRLIWNLLDGFDRSQLRRIWIQPRFVRQISVGFGCFVTRDSGCWLGQSDEKVAVRKFNHSGVFVDDIDLSPRALGRHASSPTWDPIRVARSSCSRHDPAAVGGFEGC